MSAWYGANAQAAGTYSGSYYDQLSDDAKEFYNKFMTKFENGDTPDEDDANYPNIKCYNIDIKKNMTCDSDDDSVISAKLNSELNNWAYPAAYSAYYALVYDHPELTWMDGRKSIQILSELKGIKSNGTYSGEITLRLGLSENVIPEATPATMSSLISAAKSEIDKSLTATSDNYDKLKAIHDYLCNQIAYNHTAADSSQTKYNNAQVYAYQTAYSAFAKCNSDTSISTVCAGYAKSFKILSEEYGIPCALITGLGVTGVGKSEAHAWNAVKLDGKWYAVDCTWDDQTAPESRDEILMDYFLAGADTESTQFSYNDTFSNTHRSSSVITTLNFGGGNTCTVELTFPELNPTAYEKPAEVTPGVPAGLKAEAGGDGEVVLTWDAAENANSYNVYVNGELKESGITDTTYSVLNLENGTEYSFAVSAVSSTNTESAKSEAVKATPHSSYIPAVVPEAPTGLKAEARDGEVVLTWNSAERATFYNVYVNGELKKSGITDTTYTVTGLTNGTEYGFVVSAVSSTNTEGAKSDEVKASPVKPEVPEVTPAAPTGLKAAAGDGQAELTWDKVENAKSYTVYQDRKAIKTGLTDTNFTVTGLTNGTKYTFTVTATADKESVHSAEAAATPAKAEVPEVTPAAPTGLKATVGDGKVELTWDTVKNAKFYTVYQDGKFIKTGLTDTKFTVTGLTNGTKYTFTVTATADKESAQSAAAEVTPAKPSVTLPAPRNLKAAAGDEEVKLTWDKVDGATSYSVYMDGRLVKSGITDAEYTVTGLKNNERYKFAVSGDATDANSTRSSTVSARPYHTHTWSDDYKHNSTDHWKYCVMCDEAGTKATHRFSGWKTVYGATKDSAGLKRRTCSVCGYDQEEKIPATSGGSSGGSSSRPSGGSSGGSSSGKPSTTTEILPSIGGVDKSWDNVAADIKSAPAGSVIVINSKGSAKLPANVVAAIKSSGAKVELVVDSVKTWIIDGSALNTTAAIDLTSAAGSADTSALRGAVGAKLKTSAANPGAALRLMLKYEYAGQFANLYRVENGKNVFVGCVKVDSFGAAVIPGITSAGEYVVMAGRYSDLGGDSNNDGMINAIDVSDILKHITGISASANIQMADFNGDGTVNALDASAILKAIVSM